MRSSSSPTVGTIVAGKYRLEGVMGEGGMGVVMSARHVDLGIQVAVKFMLERESEEQVARFMREARSAAKLRSEHVARVTDVGRLEGGDPYMVMEHLDGCDLADFLDERGPLPVPAAAAFAMQALEALDEAHRTGIVHRDIKPGNLFVTSRSDGSPCIKVLDFGIAKDQADIEAQLTKTSVVCGSPGYMAPEQMRSAKHVDHRVDLWAMGVVFYELLTGRQPFEAESVTEVVARVLRDTPPPPSIHVPELPPALDRLVMRALARDPDARFHSAREMIDALSPFCAGLGRPSSPGTRTEAWDGPLPRAVIAGDGRATDDTRISLESTVVTPSSGRRWRPVAAAGAVLCGVLVIFIASSERAVDLAGHDAAPGAREESAPTSSDPAPSAPSSFGGSTAVDAGEAVPTTSPSVASASPSASAEPRALEAPPRPRPVAPPPPATGDDDPFGEIRKP